MGQRDYLQLLTTWDLFAPVPVGGDCRLLIRDRLSNGKQTRWREVPLIRDRRPLHVLWNTDLLPATTAYRYMLALAERQEETARVCGQSVPYLAVLRYVSHLPRSEEAVARRIVALHGGRLWVESVLGEGSTFHFTVPLRVARQAELA